MSVLTITNENFETQVLNCQQPVLLDFWASWCGPCRMVAPIIEKLAEERPDITFGKVNIDQQPELAAQFGVTAIPTLVVMDGGAIVAQAVGARPKEMILEMLNFD